MIEIEWNFGESVRWHCIWFSISSKLDRIWIEECGMFGWLFIMNVKFKWFRVSLFSWGRSLPDTSCRAMQKLGHFHLLITTSLIYSPLMLISHYYYYYLSLSSFDCSWLLHHKIQMSDVNELLAWTNWNRFLKTLPQKLFQIG